MNVRKVCELVGRGVKSVWLLVRAAGVWFFGMVALLISGGVLLLDDHELGELLTSHALPGDAPARVFGVVVLILSVLLVSWGARQLDDWWSDLVGAWSAPSKESL